MSNNPWTATDIPSQIGRRAIVTGANSGIGWHTALELARNGAEVILASRSMAKAEDAAARTTRHDYARNSHQGIGIPLANAAHAH